MMLANYSEVVLRLSAAGNEDKYESMELLWASKMDPVESCTSSLPAYQA